MRDKNLQKNKAQKTPSMQRYINWCFAVTILAVFILGSFMVFNQKSSANYLENYFTVLDNIYKIRDLITNTSDEANKYILNKDSYPIEEIRTKLEQHKKDIEANSANFLLSSYFAETDSVLNKDKLLTEINNYIEFLGKFITASASSDGTVYLERAVVDSRSRLLPMLSDAAEGYTSDYNARLNATAKSQLIWLIGTFILFLIISIAILHPVSKKIARAYDLMVKQNQVRAKLLAGMNHRLRTPIQTIVSNTNKILKESSDKKFHHDAIAIINSADIVLNTINDIVDFHRMETGRFSIEQKSINLKKIVEQVISPLAEEAKDKGVELKFDILKDAPTSILGDSGRIVQVLSNLVSNAIRFTEKGKVEIRIEKIQGKNSENFLKVQVIDTGAGIEKNKQKGLFDWFSAENLYDDNEVDTGKGFGLSIVKTLVKEMGGDMGLDSEPGKGSNFWFTLPANQNSASGANTIAETFAGVAVILAEDNNASREFSTGMLENLGCKVYPAENGQAAIDQAKKNKFSLIFLDCQMPVMDGYETAKKLREMMQKNEIASAPIVALTAASDSGNKEKCIAAGMDDYYCKTVNLKDYQMILEKWIKAKNKKTA